MQFQPFEPGIEAKGEAIRWMVAGFRILPSTGIRYLTKHGLTKTGPDGKPFVDFDGWIAQEPWLRCFEAIANEVGSNVVRDIGRHLGANTEVPPTIKGLEAGMRYLDAGYHLYHRKHGKVMFDPASGRMLEGIGHYGCQVTPGKNEIVSVCENPYPCDFDHGILEGFVPRLATRGHVEHDAKAPCRKQGADSCTFRITW